MALMTITIPYNLTREQLVVDPRDVSPADDLMAVLSWIAGDEENPPNPGETERIMRAAVLVHERTRHPIVECLQQAIVWERG